MKRWLITGISSGIGAALARAALDRGDAVIGTARDEAACAAFEAIAPGRAIALRLDIAIHADIPGAIARAFDGGPIDIVVSNAGRSLFGAFEETALDEVKALFDVNVFGTWAVAEAVLPRLRAQGGGILVHVSSGCGINGTPGLSAYSASKFAIEGFTEALVREVARFGIKAMLVEPGAINTRFISHGTRATTRRLPEYDFLSGAGKDALDAYYATAGAPPETVAQAIIAAIESDDPPLRLVVGDDVRASVAAKAVAFAALGSG
ncbi:MULTISPECIES: SDR family oxidoreductase [unclassified Sphingobium]|uniref:SDR family oxidoreductase n=1 Tax=unclassified Sphingobium TaxID=2611147 RepID=UPI001199DC19|nr:MULTISPECIES: SDR family oxidoreductase [unclassified Sphingobium]MBG6120012.1 NAD(P)-dependent dehydrogenase (short-subunit alcohol dehydrogenase family) [Sphingobium sp. JAI105]TWD05787.1 short-subunit dehydrogenase [Sphingobium sp. AEW010]TWD23340.1 short-subunit dehydrogenase [Sphingobium sp. AEW013]TWD25200.1 short-subunit dehydrogenase [Sphingobium sp. AEW001]